MSSTSAPPSSRLFTVIALVSAACGSSLSRPAIVAEPVSGDDAGVATVASLSTAPAAESAPATIPTTCSGNAPTLCTPDVAFVKRFCNGSFPDIALVLFGKDTPFVRMYMKADVDGWNADGGASARARLREGEEMLVLRRRAPPSNGMVVGSGGAGYLVMRWDGNCYTLEDGEISPKRPGTSRYAPIPWRLYSDETKNALLATPKVLAAYQKRGKECKGAVSGEVTKACENADGALSTAVVTEIRGGLVIPTPEHLP